MKRNIYIAALAHCCARGHWSSRAGPKQILPQNTHSRPVLSPTVPRQLLYQRGRNLRYLRAIQEL